VSSPALTRLFDDPNAPGKRGSCGDKAFDENACQKKRPNDRFLCRTGMFDLLADT